MAVTI